MDNKIVMISIAAVIGIIVLGSVLMPILDDATTVNETFTNDGYYRVSKATADSNVTIVWDHTDPTILTVNGTDLDMSGIPKDQPLTIYASEEAVVRYTNGTSGVSINRYGGSYQNATESNAKDVSITLSGSSATMVWGTSTDTLTATGVYYIDPDGDYVMKKSDSVAKVKSDESVLLIAGTSNVSGAVTLYGTGTIDDGLTISVVAGLAEGDTYSIGDVTINYTDLTKYIDLADLTSIQFPFTKNTTTATITYSYFVVPYEVTAERSVHFTDGQNAIFAAMPVMIILAVLLGVVALVIRSRMD